MDVRERFLKCHKDYISKSRASGEAIRKDCNSQRINLTEYNTDTWWDYSDALLTINEYLFIETCTIYKIFRDTLTQCRTLGYTINDCKLALLDLKARLANLSVLTEPRAKNKVKESDKSLGFSILLLRRTPLARRSCTCSCCRVRKRNRS
jgi:hypothetical protein